VENLAQKEMKSEKVGTIYSARKKNRQKMTRAAFEFGYESSLPDAVARLRNKGSSPSCGPLNRILLRLNADMKARIILVTDWYLKFYGAFQLGKKSRKRNCRETAVLPKLVRRNRVFICHGFC
jgi:hypothetical protein